MTAGGGWTAWWSLVLVLGGLGIASSTFVPYPWQSPGLQRFIEEHSVLALLGLWLGRAVAAALLVWGLPGAIAFLRATCT